MDDKCNAVSECGLTCNYSSASHATHSGRKKGFPFGHPDAMVFWDNEDFVAPAPVVSASKAKPKTAKELLQIADKAQSRSVDRGIQNTDPKLMARAEDPDTSVAAAQSASLSSGTFKALLLAQYAAGEGLIDEEAASLAGLSGRGWWQRSAELRNEEMILDTGMRRFGASGRLRMVCVITDKGMSEYLKLRVAS